MIIADHYRRAVDGFSARVLSVTADEWDRATECCPDWDVRALVRHVTEETRWAPPLLVGRSAEQTAREVEQAGESDPVEDWRNAADAARTAVTESAFDGTVQLPGGETPAGEYIAELCADTFIHTWDLARATDGDTELDPDLVEVVARWFDGVEDGWRAGGAIGPPADVPDDADAQTRLLARFGRRS